MKLNKTFGRIATTLVATAMLASMAVVPASAADAIQEGDDMTTFTFTKEFVKPVDVPMPSDATFKFTLAGVNLSETVEDEEGNAIVTTAGTTTVDDITVTFNGDESKGTAPVAGLELYTQDVTVDLPVNDFTKPGIYTYTLTEEDKGGDYTTPAASKVYVYVTGLDDPEVTGVVMLNGNDVKTGTKTATVRNYYMSDETGADANELKVTKTVTGDMGDKTHPFAFSVKVESTNTAKTYTLRKYGANNQQIGRDVTLNANIENETITLANGEYIRIFGLSSGDDYTVIETVANDDNYVTTIDNAGTPITTENAEYGASGEFGETNVTVAFTNDRNAVSPTGLVMDIAPYALLVVVAAAGCFVFLRKRRED